MRLLLDVDESLRKNLEFKDLNFFTYSPLLLSGIHNSMKFFNFSSFVLSLGVMQMASTNTFYMI